MLGGKSIAVVTHGDKKKNQAQREKKPHWRKQGTDFEDDNEKPCTVSQQADVAFTAALARADRDIGDRKPCAKKGHSAGSGIGKTVR